MTLSISHPADPATIAADAAFASAFVYDGKVLGRASINTGGPYTIATSTDTDIDATNLIVTFTVPASGSVDVVFEGGMDVAADDAFGYVDWMIRESTSLVGVRHRVFGGVLTVSTPSTAQMQARIHCEIRITGLTPAASKTYKWGWRRSSGSSTFNMYPTDAPSVMTVKAVA